MNKYIIEVQNLSKSFKEQRLFSHVSFSLNYTGFYGLEGPSGSGKSSLLYILGLLDSNYEGTYLYEGESVIDKEKILKNDIGFAFQNSVFFNDMDVIENLVLFNDKKDEIEINYLLECMDLFSKKNTQVKKLSGGERMRLAIVRAFLNDPKIVFLDEPTAALDPLTSIKVMEFLKEQSSKRCIFMVSHDATLLKENVDELFVLKNQRIEKITLQKKEEKEVDIKEKKEGGKLSTHFIFKYFKTCFKRRKGNALLCIFALFFSLFTIGFSLLLKDQVGNEIKDSFSSLMNQNQVLLESKSEEESLERITISKEEAEEIILNNPYFESYGYLYKGEFEAQFIDSNYITLHDKEDLNFMDINLRTISEAILVDDIPSSKRVYPFRPSHLLDDEGILGLRRSDIRRICDFLKLANSDENTLSNYLEYHSLDMSFIFENRGWGYKNEIPFRLKGFFIVDGRPLIAHTNPFYTKYIFEEQMKLPISEDLNRSELYPWTIKRATYIRAKKNQEEDALRYFFQSDDYPLYDLEKMKSDLHSDAYSSEYHARKYIVSYASKGKISYQDVLKVSNYKEEDLFPIALPYSVSKEILASGFFNTIILSSSDNILDEIESYYDDIENNLDQEDVSAMDYGDNVIGGNLISSALNKGLRLSFDSSLLIAGEKASNYHEIEISSALASKLFSSKENAINQRVYLSFHQFIDNRNVFKKTSLIISGVFESEQMLIYQQPFWFQILSVLDLDYDLQNVRVTSYLLKSDKDVFDLQNQFPSFIFSNPLKDIYENIDNVLMMLQIILFTFTILLCASSIGILFITIQNTLKDAFKEIGLLKSLGTNKNSIVSLYFMLSSLYSFIGLILSILSVIVVDKILLVFYFEKPLNFTLPLSTLGTMVLFDLILTIPLILVLLYIPLKKESISLLKQYY